MDIYEYWHDQWKKKSLSSFVVVAPTVKNGEWLSRYHIEADNRNFNRYVISNNINPVALGYAPISR